jgi:hypothetical protein
MDYFPSSGNSPLFFAVSGVQLAQTKSGLFHFRRVAFSSQLRVKVDSTLAKAAVLRVNLNLCQVTVHCMPIIDLINFLLSLKL